MRQDLGTRVSKRQSIEAGISSGIYTHVSYFSSLYKRDWLKKVSETLRHQAFAVS